MNDWLQSVARNGGSGNANEGAATSGPSQPAPTGLPTGQTGPADPAGAAGDTPAQQQARAAATRARIHEAFGQVILIMAGVPRYRHLALYELQALVMEPLLRDKIAMARARTPDGSANVAAPAGIAFWASVSDEVDARIKEQIAANVFPVRLKPEDWGSGPNTWLLDVIAPNTQVVTTVLSTFQAAMKQPGEIRIHPFVARQIDPEVLKKMSDRQPSSAGQGNSGG